MKKITILLILFCGLIININVYANTIQKINMDIYIDQNGDAKITETWEATLSEGTEGYKPYYNYGNAAITNFSVSMNGTEFNTLKGWNTNASFNDKAYKAGINNVTNGIELCFGISQYGHNTYTMKYDIKGFVSTLNDADMIYWTLIPQNLSTKPDSVYIKIHSDFKYDNEWDIWGYGYEAGYAYFHDGYIEMSTNGALLSNEYMVALVKFPKGTFTTTNVIEGEFASYLEKANEGSTPYNPDYSYNGSENSSFPWLALITPLVSGAVIAVSIGAAIKYANQIGTKKLKFAHNKKINKNTPYFRDIPCDSDIFKAYWVSANYWMIKNKTDILGALLLKWLKEDSIMNTTITSKWLKKEEKAIKFITSNNMSGIELEIYSMMEEASIDGILEPTEFKKWCGKNYHKVLGWFDKIANETTERFVTEGKIDVEGRTYHVKESLKEEAIKMMGLKNYLKHFSNIKERESIEVKLWDYYLIYAQIFGIAKTVAKEFKKLYPELITDDYYDNMIFIHTFSHTGMSSASAAKSRAESYSSGGGGFSSGGGGGGSFGGGGGGGGFR